MKPSIRATVLVLSQPPSLCLLGLVHVGDELREVNGIAVLHKRPDEISQILVRVAWLQGGGGGDLQRPSMGASQPGQPLPLLPCSCEDGADRMVSSSPAFLSVLLFGIVFLFAPALLSEDLSSLGFILV